MCEDKFLSSTDISLGNICVRHAYVAPLKNYKSDFRLDLHGHCVHFCVNTFWQFASAAGCLQIFMLAYSEATFRGSKQPMSRFIS